MYIPSIPHHIPDCGLYKHIVTHRQHSTSLSNEVLRPSQVAGELESSIATILFYDSDDASAMYVNNPSFGASHQKFKPDMD
jgi:hypothetical protein